jgi:hypothetical protein
LLSIRLGRGISIKFLIKMKDSKLTDKEIKKSKTKSPFELIEEDYIKLKEKIKKKNEKTKES